MNAHPVRKLVVTIGIAIVLTSALALPASAAVTIDARLEHPSIAFGTTVRVLGSVNNPPESPRVVLQREVDGVWRDRATTDVDVASGAFAFQIRPTTPGVYHLRVRSVGGRVTSRHLTLQVTTKPFVTAHLTSTTTAIGTPVFAVGKMTPPASTRLVVLQRYIRGRWYDRDAGLVDQDTGEYRIKVQFNHPGTYALRIRSNGGTVKSVNMYLRVRAAA